MAPKHRLFVIVAVALMLLPVSLVLLGDTSAPPNGPTQGHSHLTPFVGSVPAIYSHKVQAYGPKTSPATIGSLNTKAGDFIVLWIATHTKAGGTVTVTGVTDNKSQTYTRLAYIASSNYNLTEWYKNNSGGPYTNLLLSAAFTFGGGVTQANMTMVAVVLDGVNTLANPIDATATSSYVNSTSLTNSLVTTGTNDIILEGMLSETNPTVTAAGGDTKFDSSAGNNRITGTDLYRNSSSQPAGTYYMNATINVAKGHAGEAIAISPPQAAVPNAPTGLTVGAATLTTVALTWTQPAGTVVNDTVYSSQTSQTAWVGHSTSGSATSYTVTGLSCGMPYFFRVTAWNSTGQSVPSSVKYALTSTTGCGTNAFPTIYSHAANGYGSRAPSVPATTTINVHQGDVVVVWTAAQNGSGTIPYVTSITDSQSHSYTELLNSSSATDGLTMWDSVNMATATTGLIISAHLTTWCNVTVAAMSVSGENRTAPTDGQSAKATGTGTSFNTSWTTNHTRDLLVTGVAVADAVTVSADASNTKLDSTGANSKITDADLYKNQTGTGTVFMGGAISLSKAFQAVSLAIKPANVPSAPTSLSVTGQTKNSIALSWTQPAGTVVNDTIYYGLTSPPGTKHSTSGAVSTYNLTGLSCGLTYHLYVTAWNASGESLPSNTVTGATTGGPTCIINLYGNQAVSTATTYANSTLALWGGNFTCTAGSLTFDNETVLIQQNNTGTGTLAPLNHGIAVTSSTCALVIKYSTVQSNNTAADPTWVYDTGVTSSVTIIHSKFQYLGAVGAGSHLEGLEFASAHIGLAYDVFDTVYQIKFASGTNVGDSISHSYIANGTFNSASNALIVVNGGASWFNMTNDTVYVPQRNMIVLSSTANHLYLGYNTITGNASHLQNYHLQFTFSGANNCSFSTVTHNTIQGANIYYATPAQWANITWNTVNNTGQGGSGNGLAAIQMSATQDGVGMFARHIIIAHNTLTNSTRDTIRVGDNVTNFNVSSNKVAYPDGTGVADNTEATVIYILRNSHNGTVWNNTLDIWPYVFHPTHTNGINLESFVSYVNVSFNRIYNFTQVGITNQGDDGVDAEPAWDAGPNLYNVFYHNTMINFRNVSVQHNVSTDCIQGWMWANQSKYIGNYCRMAGYSTAQSNSGYMFIQSSSNSYYGNNTAVNMTGFILFHKFSTTFEILTHGNFSHSINYLENNSFSLMKSKLVVSDQSDGWVYPVNYVRGRVSNLNYSFVAGTHAGSLRYINPIFDTLAAGSPTYSYPWINFYSKVYLNATGTSYVLNLTRFNTTQATVYYHHFKTEFTPQAGQANWYNVSQTSYNATSDEAAWSASMKVGKLAYFNLTAATVPTNYTFSVDGTDQSTVLSSSPAVSFNWNSWTTHSFVISEQPAPAAPTGLTSSSVTTTSVGLSWTNPGGGGLVNNTVYVAAGTSCAGAMTAHSMGSAVTSYTVIGLSTGVEYAFAVTVWDATGQSPQSNCYVKTTAQVSAAPSGLTSSSVTTTSVSLSWTNPGGGGLVNDTVYWATGVSCAGAMSAHSLGSAGTTYTVGSLTTGTEYAFTVTVWNVTGQSPQSNCYTKTTAQIPSAPTGLTSSATTTTSVSLSWSNPSGVIINVTVYYATGTSCAGALTAHSMGGVATSYTVTSLSTGTEYAFAVTAWNATGQSPQSNCYVKTTAQLPVAPTSLTATSHTTTSVLLTWTNAGGGGLLNVTVYYKAGAACTGTLTAISVGSALTTYNVTSLTLGTQYAFAVTDWNVTGQSPQSNCLLNTTSQNPLAPTGLTSTSVTTTSVSLSWSNGGGSFLNNTIYYKVGTSCAGTLTAQSRGSAGTTYTVGSLTTGTEYSFTVTVWNATGQSPKSNCYVKTTAQLPTAPTGLTSTAITKTSVALSWTNPSVVLVNITVYYKAGSSCAGTLTAHSMGGVATSDTVTSLTTGTEYAFTVTVWNVTGQSPQSNCYVKTTAQVPAVPSGLAATAFTATSISLGWTNPGGGGLVNVTIYRIAGTSCAGVMSAHSLGSVGTSYTVGSLTTGTEYAFAVTAWNATGQSPQSNCYVKTTAQTPGAPTAVSVGNVTDAGGAVSWAQSSGGGILNDTVYLYGGLGCGGPATTYNTTGPGTSWSLSGLNASTNYSVQVSATNATGVGTLSGCIDFATFSGGGTPIPVTGADGLIVLAAMIGIVLFAAVIASTRLGRRL